jgi:hypothetical protein
VTQHRGDRVGVEVPRLAPFDAGALDERRRITREQPVAHRTVEGRPQNRVGLSDRRVRQRPHRLRLGIILAAGRPLAWLGLGAHRQHQRLDVGRPQLVEPDRAERRRLEVAPAQVRVQHPRRFFTVGRGESGCPPMLEPFGDRGAGVFDGRAGVEPVARVLHFGPHRLSGRPVERHAAPLPGVGVGVAQSRLRLDAEAAALLELADVVDAWVWDPTDPVTALRFVAARRAHVAALAAQLDDAG